MLRSRSSFEDLDAAIASASSLSDEEADAAGAYRGVPLVSFDRGPASVMPPPAPVADPAHIPPPPRSSTPRSGQTGAPGFDDLPPESLNRPPRLPDFSGVVSPVQRCERIVEWIVEATMASDVFLADGSGLPLAGSIADAESRIAGSGLVASALLQLAASLPGATSPTFELHLGDGPFFQLIGFEAEGALYLVGLTRANPLTPRQAHAIRLACRHALGDADPNA